MGKQPHLYTFSEADTLARSLRKYILDCQSNALQRHEVFKLAVSGGSLPKTLAKALLAQSTSSDDNIEFSKWEIFFADERLVPLEHEDSNYRLLKDELLDRIPSEYGSPVVHSINTDHLDNAQEAADDYMDKLRDSFAKKDSVKLPIFDLLLLGCGPDGHTCSLFPKHDLLNEKDAWVGAIEDSPKPPSQRITLTLPVVISGLKIAFVATGAGKRDIMQQILDSDDGRSLPCGLVNEQGAEKVSWFTDEAAVEGVRFPRRGNL